MRWTGGCWSSRRGLRIAPWVEQAELRRSIFGGIREIAAGVERIQEGRGASEGGGMVFLVT